MNHTPMGRQNGAAIRAFRKKERMSRAQLASYVGLHEASLTNIENGRRPAAPEVIGHLARVLAVPVEAITRSGTAEGIPEDEPEPGAAKAA